MPPADYLREEMLDNGIAGLDCGYPHPVLPHWRLRVEVWDAEPDQPCLTWVRPDKDGMVECAVDASGEAVQSLAMMRHYDMMMPMEVAHADR